MMEEIVCLGIYVVTEFISYLLAYAILFQMYVTMNGKRWLLGICTILCIHFFLMHSSGVGYSASMTVLTMYVIPIFLLDSKKEKCFYFYPIIAIGTSVAAVCVSFLMALFLDMSAFSAVHNKWVVLLSKSTPVLLLLVFYGYRKYRRFEKIQIRLEPREYLILLIVMVFAIPVLSSIHSIIPGDSITNIIINAGGFALSLSCSVLVIFILWQGILKNKEIYLKERVNLKREYMRLQGEYFNNLMNQDEKMRRFHHDMDTHITVLKAYCQENKYEELENYLKVMTKESAIYDVIYYTGNRGVDAVISRLVEDADQKKISIEIRGRLPEKTKVFAYDLSTIISNLIKNALEACEQINSISNRFVIIEVGSFNSQILIVVKNTIAGEVYVKDNHLIRSKKDKKYHGLGSGNVEKTVKKYNGFLEYSCENGWFKVEVMI